jgi:NADH-quinone oxidoreductase chain G
MIKIFVNSFPVFVPSQATIMEACEFVGIEIPRFCFHERLSVAGNCRACLVEIEKSPKPIVACTLPVLKNLRVFTTSPLVKKARESILEFLLINHPLDCPVCDQGGECDLQDQSLFFGSEKTRFFENKRSVENKNCGPLIKTIMTRCIHCTRCVRFFSKYTACNSLGIANRSNFAEVGTFINKIFQSEISGNIIDLCPVGALTSKSYAFIARSWEISRLESIDTTDALGSNINIDFKETTLIRILPKKKNEVLNDSWITDKCRFSFDAFLKFRIAAVYKRKKDFLVPCSLQKSLKYINYLVAFCDLNIFCSVYSSLKSFLEIKFFAEQQSINKFGYPRIFYLSLDFSENFLCNLSLLEIEKSDFCLFLSLNPRWEASALNMRLLSRFRNGFLNAISLGLHHQNSFKKTVLGICPEILLNISEGLHFLCKQLKSSKNPSVLYGGTLAERKDFKGLKKVLQYVVNVITSNFQSLCFINQEQNQVGAFTVGLKSFSFALSPNLKAPQFFSQLHSKTLLKTEKVFFFLGSFRNIEITSIEKKIPLKRGFRITLSSYGCDFNAKGHLIIPTKNFLEKKGLYTNFQGKVNKTKATFSQMVKSSRTESSLFELFRKNSYVTTCSLTWKNIKKLEEGFCIETFYFSGSFQNKGKIFFFSFLEEKSVPSIISNSAFTGFLTDFF